MSRTLKDLMDESFARHAGRIALRVLREQGGELAYRPVTYAELHAQRDRLAAGLAGLGLQKGQRLGLLTEGGLESVLVFLAADTLGLCCVPLCNKLAPELLIHTIHHSGIELLFTDARGEEAMGRIDSFIRSPLRRVRVEGAEWEGLLASEGAPPAVEVLPEDVSKILYTSGSSGLPKGVVQTHANIAANVEEVWDLISEREPFRLFKSAPDYHSMGVLNIYYPLAKGWVLDLARSPDRVLSDIRYSEPEGFLTVPLVLDKVFGNVRKEIQAGGLKGRLVQRAVRARQNLARGQAGMGDRLVDATIGGKVVAAIREQLNKRVGANLELLIVGSAKADPEALDFFQEVLGIRTLEGYGTTECAPLIAANHLGGRKVGTVGRPLIEVRLVGAQGEELGYGAPASGTYRGSGGQTGELWVSGPNVMKGYLDDPDQTAQVLVEDASGKVWYRTGDLFSMDEEGFLRFSGRVGRQFKLRNGEFINPELLERIYARAPLVEHVLIWGDQHLGAPLALVAVDVEEARKIHDLPGLPAADEAALRVFPALADRVRQSLLREADEAGLPSHDRPQKVILLPEPLSEEAGTLTKGLKKVVPGEVLRRYHQVIEGALRG
jgi:long-chain acyl-CoA synthetase